MKRFFTHFLLMAIAAGFILSTASCKSDDPQPERKPRKMTMLVYAVVSDLNLESDKEEMLRGAANIDLEENSLFVYQVYKTGLPQLLELSTNSKGEKEFQVVKVYDRDLYSTDPARISAVIEDVKKMNPAEGYGMVFWSHGTGWSPSFSNHGVSSASGKLSASLPSVSSFGSDLDLDRNPTYTDRTDIDELADAIPDHGFNFIWFDVCYMGGIETVYQLRNKADYIIAMPTEDAGNGMPYDLTLPYLLTENPDCVKAAQEFFRYYDSGLDDGWAVATVGVYYTPNIEAVADYCRRAYAGAQKPSSYALQSYHRFSNGPFYDFGQYTRRIASTNENAPAAEEFEAAMEKFVIYKAATKFNFSGKEIDQQNYSGLSCHLYDPEANDEKTEFYRSLDWFKRVYE